MRGATDCARRLKSLTNSLRNKLGRITAPTVGDPVTQMLLGILTRDAQESKAIEGLERLKLLVVDYNELRVIPPIELAEHLDDFTEMRLKAEDITRSLNAIFAREHEVTLDKLAEMSQRDAHAYLEKIDGLDPYTIARVRLLGLGHHALPLDEAMWAYARQTQIVSPKATLDEAQQFLERHVPADHALEVFAMLRKAAWQEFATAVRKRQVERIVSVPPDRTTRNMLQAIASGQVVEAEDDLPPELALEAGLGVEPGAESAIVEAPETKSKRRAKPAKAAAPSKPDAPARTATRAKPARTPAAKPARRDAAARPAPRSGAKPAAKKTASRSRKVGARSR